MPATPLAGALQNRDPAQRVTAAVILVDTLDMVDAGDLPAPEKVLVGALSDPDMRVRESCTD